MLNSVSFGGKIYNDYDLNMFDDTKSHYSSQKFTPIQDTYHFTHKETSQPQRSETKPQTTKSQPRKTNSNYSKPFQKFVSLLMAAAFGASVYAAGDAISEHEPKPDIVNLPFAITSVDHLENVAEAYQTDIDTIVSYNGCESPEEMVGKENIAIPSAYNPFQERFEEIQGKLKKNNLSEKKQAELMSEMEFILNKMQQQDESATAYQDGKFVYFQMKKDMNAETFKDIWGIKDGALHRYNLNLDYSFYSVDHGPMENDSHYKDYTNAVLYEGNTYKVPVNSCGYNFMGYYQD